MAVNVVKSESMEGEMSGNEGVDIDLYADDIEQDFNTDEFAGDGVDLYDDVIANTGSRGEGGAGGGGGGAEGERTVKTTTTFPEEVDQSRPALLHPGEIHPSTTAYQKPTAFLQSGGTVGMVSHPFENTKFTLWTSDQSIKTVLAEIGVNDFIEVKFYENRANGQSKGYCVLTVGSESSLRSIHDKLPKKEIHGQTPIVTPPTKQALNQFEAQSKTRPVPGQQNNMNQQNNMGNMMGGGPRGPMGGPMGSGGHGPPMGGPGGMGGFGPRMMGGPGPMHRGPRMPPGMPPRNMGPPNQQGGPPGPGYNGPQRPQMGPNNMGPGPGGPQQRPPDSYFQGPGPMGPMGGPQGGMGGMGGPPRGPGPQGPMGPGPGMDHRGMDPRGPPPPRGGGGGDWNRPPMNSYQHGGPPGPGPMPGPPNRGPPPAVAPPMLPGHAPLQGAPAPHMNPAFFNQGPGPQGPPQGGGGPPPTYGGPPQRVLPITTFRNGGPGYVPATMDPRDQPPQMSEVEFEEVMGRNRTVSSSAISRAVQDAATGEFASAIETLVTAISLIKQSKVANDDRCKILISSLQDTLHGIESKSYGRQDRSRSPRDRDRRSSRHGGGGRRERSRSRERDYRDRSRERDRYYEYPRERSRSREREYRERGRGEERYGQTQPDLAKEAGGTTSSSRSYYEERERYTRDRGGSERERRVVDPDRSRERERDPEVHRATRH